MENDSIEFNASFFGERHSHIWGHELWLVNNAKYCSKLLVVNKGFASSFHYHERKHETFIVVEGVIELTLVLPITNVVTISPLHAGERFTIDEELIHSFMSREERGIIMEVSTTDDDDNVKLFPATEIDSIETQRQHAEKVLEYFRATRNIL